MPKNSSWGIEVGSNAIKAIRLVRQGEQVVVDAYQVVPFKKVLTTPDLDVNGAIWEGLGKLLSATTLRRGSVVVSVPGTAAFAKFAKLPPVEPKKIPDIVKFEAVQQIPYRIEDVQWDYQVFTQPDSPDIEVGIFAITKDRVGEILDNYQAAGLNVDALTLSALAVYNALAYDLDLGPDSPGTLLMDIGTSSTDIIIVEGGSVWLRTLSIGGNQFTEALVRAFKLSFAKAEKLKREAGTSKYARQIFQAMRPVFADLIQEMQRTLGFHQIVNREAQVTRLVGMGSSFRLPGMQKFLSQQLQMEVHRLDSFKRIGVEGKRASDFAKYSLNMATAYGLALQGLGLEKVHANLLPVHMVKRRVWRAKQPWFAATAALMMFASMVAWAKLRIDKNIFDANLKVGQPVVQETLHVANEYVQAWRLTEGRSDPRRRIENLRRILDYREVWPKLMHDLTLAIRTLNPQPPLLTTQYEAIRAIPRRDRRRIYIDSISANYQFNQAGATPLNDASRLPVLPTIQDIWGGLSVDASGERSPLQAPSFLITLKGTTPHRDGPKLISQNMIRWLAQNSQRNNRPYRIEVTNQSLRSVERVGEARADVAQKLAARRPVDPLAGRRRSEAHKGARSTRRGDAASGARAGVVGDSVDRVIPRRPLGDESSANDWSFEIQWTVRLVRPEDARRAEDPA